MNSYLCVCIHVCIFINDTFMYIICVHIKYIHMYLYKDTIQ